MYVDFVLLATCTYINETQSWTSGVWFNKFKVRSKTDNKHSMIFNYELAICFESDGQVHYHTTIVHQIVSAKKVVIQYTAQ
jgi:hypothetical protein